MKPENAEAVELANILEWTTVQEDRSRAAAHLQRLVFADERRAALFAEYLNGFEPRTAVEAHMAELMREALS